MYKLLIYHMNPNPDYLFGHAEIAGMLATNDPKVSNYESYKLQCNYKGITYYNEDCYNQFMLDCKRTSHIAVDLQLDNYQDKFELDMN